jgi:SAM-dependent methyltransferase
MSRLRNEPCLLACGAVLRTSTLDRCDREREFHNAPVQERWKNVGKFYAITSTSQGHYESLLLADCCGKQVLEYGCGEGSSAFLLARNGATVTGIDISDFRIRQARQQARSLRINDVSLLVMNAEDVQFPEDTFDLICGTGILHHLDLDSALAEVARTLRPDGRAVFLEPLGHNPAINAYRRRTPRFRTRDEHPLLMRDLALLEAYFGRVEARFFHLTTLLAVPLRRTRVFTPLFRTLDFVDRSLFRLFPFVRRYAWTTVFSVAEPLPGVAREHVDSAAGAVP